MNFQVLSDIWSKFAIVFKGIGIVFATGAIFFGVFKFVEQGNETAAEVKSMKDTLTTGLGSINGQLDRININILDLQERNEKQVQSFNRLQNSYIDHARKTVENTDELYDILKDFINIEKKNGDKPIVYYVRPIDTTHLNLR